MKLSTNPDHDKYSYSGHGISFEVRGPLHYQTVVSVKM